jgi:hypothetical protein
MRSRSAAKLAICALIAAESNKRSTPLINHNSHGSATYCFTNKHFYIAFVLRVACGFLVNSKTKALPVFDVKHPDVIHS